MDFPKQPQWYWHLLRADVFLLSLLLLLQSGGVRGEIESILDQRSDDQPWHVWLGRFFGKWGIGERTECEEQYGIMPCSVSLGGTAFLLFVYGFVLYKCAMLVSDGSELLLTKMRPGIVGGFVLPILGTLPEAWLIVASGLGGSEAEAQEQMHVGMGLLAGSSVLLLTAIWGACLIRGRCDLEAHPTTGQLVAKDRTRTKGLHFTETGVTTDRETKWMSWIMMATLLPFFVAQIPRLFGLNLEGNFFIAIAAVIAVLGLFAFCTYQFVYPWIQERKIMYAKQCYRRNHALLKVFHLTNEQNWGSLFTSEGKPNEEALIKLFDHFDLNHDRFLTETELRGLIIGLKIKRHNGQVPDKDDIHLWMSEFDVSGDCQISREEFLVGIKQWMMMSPFEYHGWKFEAQKAQRKLLQALEDDDDDDDEEDENRDRPRNQIIGIAVAYLIAGSLLAVIFADPFVAAIAGFSIASGTSPFFVSFFATPLLATSFRQALHFRLSLTSFVAAPLAAGFKEAVHFDASTKRKRKKHISMAYCQIYGAVTMKNTLCLGVFLAIVYFRHLVWDFSAEVFVIVFATLSMGFLVAVRTTFQLWMAFVGLALYPLSIALVAYLENVWGWH